MTGSRPAAASLMVNKGRRGESHALSIDLGIMKLENVLKLTAPFVLGAATMSVAQLQPPLTLEVPLACRFGETCFVQSAMTCTIRVAYALRMSSRCQSTHW